MFKKTVLFAILLVALLVLSGCGVYDSAFKGDSADKSYGGFKVPYASFPHDENLANNDCKDADMMQIGDLCFAVGDAARCSTLDDVQNSGVKWASVNVPKYNVNICYPTCLNMQGGKCRKISADLTIADAYFPACVSDADCLLGLTHCDLTEKYCAPDSDLSTSGAVVQANTVIANAPVQDITVSANTLTVELELNRVDRAHAWVNVYLRSASKTQIYLINKLQIIPSDGKITKLELDPLFKTLTNGDEVQKSSIWVYGNGPFPITPSAKIYVGRALLETINGNPETIQFTLDQGSSVWYDSTGSLFTLSMDPLSFCAPDASPLEIECVPNYSCGAHKDGCGGYIDCGFCGDGNSCVAGTCKSPVSQLASQDQLLCQGAIDASPDDKTLLGGVISALKTNPIQEDAILEIFAALNAWFK